MYCKNGRGRGLVKAKKCPPIKFELIRPFTSFNVYSERGYLEQEYIKNEKSARQIANEGGCSHQTILKYLKKFGIKTRRNVHHGRSGQLLMGSVWLKQEKLSTRGSLRFYRKLES